MIGDWNEFSASIYEPSVELFNKTRRQYFIKDCRKESSKVSFYFDGWGWKWTNITEMRNIILKFFVNNLLESRKNTIQRRLNVQTGTTHTHAFADMLSTNLKAFHWIYQFQLNILPQPPPLSSSFNPLRFLTHGDCDTSVSQTLGVFYDLSMTQCYQNPISFRDQATGSGREGVRIKWIDWQSLFRFIIHTLACNGEGMISGLNTDCWL